MTTNETDTLADQDPSEVAGQVAVDEPGADSPPAEPTSPGTPSERTPGEESQGDETPPSIDDLTAQRDAAKAAAAAADAKATEYREQIARDALARQAAQRESAEKTAREADAQRVEDGEMTATEAVEAAEKRRIDTETQARIDAHTDEVMERVFTEGSFGVRSRMAVKFADQYEITDIRPLLDESIADEAAMEARAKQISEDAKEAAREGNEVFDGGAPGDTAPVNTNGLHGVALAELAYSDAETARGNRRR